MKKIMSAALVAGMLAGTVTAADIGFSYKGSNYFKDNKDNSEYIKYMSNLRADCLALTLTTDVAGVVVDFDTEDGAIKKDEYYGWLNFGLPVGSLQVTAGRWSSRYVNRIIADKGDLDREDFELYKPGVINGTIGKDSDNLTLGKLGIVGAWTLADALPGTLLVKLGLAQYSSDVGIGWNPDKNSVDVKAGFAGEVAYRLEDLIAVNLAVRSLNKNSYSFGLWVSPEVMDELQLTVGGTVATGKLWKSNAWTDRKTEWGVDLRARYEVTDDLSLTTMNNFSSGADTSTNDAKNEFVLWDMLNVTYAFADNLKAGLTLQSEVTGLDSDHTREWDVTISPSLIIQASERVRVSTSARANIPDIHNFALKHIGLTVPVIFTFNY